MKTQAILLLAALASTKAQCPELIWSDEFDGTSLDDTKWSPQIGDGCDLGTGMCGWGNNEWQYYTDSPENIQVSDGTLKITARYNEQTQQYTSARIRSLGKADFDMQSGKPLRLEARIKVPKDSIGLWPAFWMMPSTVEMNTWPLGGEIDIMEFIGREPNNTYGVMHYGKKWNDKSQKGGPLAQPTHVGDDFHVFALEKTSNAMNWFVDGHKFLFFTKEDVEPNFEWPFENVFHFILNLAVGGNWPEYPDDTTQFPATLEVDYVRVYDLKTSAVRPLPRIEGPTLVRINEQNVKYCIRRGSLQPVTDFEPLIQWDLPPGATYTEAQNDPTCIRVDFGTLDLNTKGGHVQATVTYTCGLTQTYKVPVEVQDYYGTETMLVGPGETDAATYELSTGSYATVDATDEAPATVVYQRKLEEVYDHMWFNTADTINEPNLFVESAKKFYMDAISETAAPCTRVYIQLEDSSVATPDNYPAGRHSRYIAFLQRDVDWQRLEFDFFDIPDRTTTKVDRMVILVDSFMQRSDTYQLRNLAIAAAGCQENCEPLSVNPCRMAAKSEEGACTDGFNNDGFGYNGDAPMDCEDSDCWNDPACQEGAEPTSPGPTLAPAPTPTGTTPAPTLPPTPRPTQLTPEICNDNIDNDNNGQTDCEDEACAGNPECGSWFQPQCNAYSQCVTEGHVGDCCPGPLGEYKECCSGEKPSSCSVHPSCAVLGLEDECCPTKDGTFLSCCQPELCLANPKCSGLDGACCPNDQGVFLDCCEEKPETCTIHPKCDGLGLAGECCPTPDGVFLDCCESAQCDVHPACAALNLEDDCCPSKDGIFLECCNLDMPVFEGFTGRVAKSSMLSATPIDRSQDQLLEESSGRSAVLLVASGMLVIVSTLLLHAL